MIHPIEQQYLCLLAELVGKSKTKAPVMERTGVGTWRVFGRELRGQVGGFGNFPLLTTKRVWWKAIVAELLWFISGSTNATALQEQGVTIWDEWAGEDGELGPVYGAQWRSFGGRGVDQLADLIRQIKETPASRRQIVTAWNPLDVPRMALPPCHMMFQTFVEDGVLSLKMTQRSADVFLGLPFNIASYALLLHILAHVTDTRPGELIVSLGDAHLYTNHVEQARLQLTRERLDAPTVNLDGAPLDIDAIQAKHIYLGGYKSHGPIKGDVAV